MNRTSNDHHGHLSLPHLACRQDLGDIRHLQVRSSKPSPFCIAHRVSPLLPSSPLHHFIKLTHRQVAPPETRFWPNFGLTSTIRVPTELQNDNMCRWYMGHIWLCENKNYSDGCPFAQYRGRDAAWFQIKCDVSANCPRMKTNSFKGKGEGASALSRLPRWVSRPRAAGSPMEEECLGPVDPGGIGEVWWQNQGD